MNESSNESTLGSIGRVLRIEHDSKEETWKAVTFVATDANSFQLQMTQLQKKLPRDEAERVNHKLLEDLKEIQDIERRRLMSLVDQLQSQLVIIEDSMLHQQLLTRNSNRWKR